MDCINITDIRCYGYTGVFPEEKSLGQWFVVDLEIYLDLHSAGTSDRLDQTLDYSQVVSVVKNITKESKFDLIERLAEVISQEILAFDGVNEVRVQLTKEAAPIPDFDGNITIDIRRRREE